MGELKIDTTGLYLPAAEADTNPLQGRILLRDDQLVCAQSPTNRVCVPVERIVDISVTDPPPDLTPQPDRIVSIAYTGEGAPTVVSVVPERMSVAKFAETLLHQIIDDIPILLSQCRGGGDTQSQPTIEARLSITAEGLCIKNSETILISYESITDFEAWQYSRAETELPGMEIHHGVEVDPICTQIVFERERYRNLLGRHLNRS